MKNNLLKLAFFVIGIFLGGFVMYKNYKKNDAVVKRIAVDGCQWLVFFPNSMFGKSFVVEHSPKCGNHKTITITPKKEKSPKSDTKEENQYEL